MMTLKERLNIVRTAQESVFVNAVETDDEKCECTRSNNWKEHWEKINKDSFPTECTTVAGCEGETNKYGKHEMVGAHVIEKSLWDKYGFESANDSKRKTMTKRLIENGNVWIAPLCKSCNDRKEERGSFKLNPETILVNANQKYCKKEEFEERLQKLCED